MAQRKKAVAENVPGDFFVDTTCIDCDACRQIAPSVFGQGDGHSFVSSQPTTSRDHEAALHALLSCPTGSIGSASSHRAKQRLHDFPLPIEGSVFYCGFNSPKSFGGNSYFIQHSGGNWLVDSPKFLGPLVRQLERLGGISRIFLTHEDDVADANQFSHHFRAPRIIHRTELAAQPDAEIVLDGVQPQELREGFVVIPTPGHSEGHCCLLFNNQFLFTGDHLAWDRENLHLTADRDYCWYSWKEQTESMERLQDFSFRWVLPGHGQRVELPPEVMQHELKNLTARMRAPS